MCLRLETAVRRPGLVGLPLVDDELCAMQENLLGLPCGFSH